MSVTFPHAFGKYVLLNKIALGGMAEIFRAKTVGAEGFEREVVIKRILPHYTEDEAFVTMFIDEATVAAKLNHANIVQIYDFDNLENQYYIAMEYIEGQDLKKVVEVGRKKEQPLSVALCTWIIIETSKGLHYAHTRKHKNQPLNIVHRDVSPHNVMVSYNGEVKLMDFGIAKAASRSTATRAGTVKGKCAYMSPEQAKGHELDGRSDLFAIGVMFWEMLTAQRLFAGDTDFATLSNVLKCEVEAPSKHNADIDEALDAIILKTLKAEADDRYDDVGEFIAELQRYFFSTVTESVQSQLTTLMEELFEGDIQALADMQAADVSGFQSVGVTDSQAARAAAAAGTGSHQVDNEAATMAMQSPLAGGTLTGSGISHTASTLALDTRGKRMPMILGGLALVGAIAFVGLSGEDSGGNHPGSSAAANAEKNWTLTIVPIPDDAQVIVNGMASTRKQRVRLGDELEITLEKNGIRTPPITVKVNGDKQRVAMEWKAPKATKIAIEIKAPDDVYIRIKGQVLGKGMVRYEDAVLNSEFLVEAYRENGEPYSRTVKAERDGQSIAIAGSDVPAGRTGAKITLQLTPPDSTVQVNGKPVTVGGGVAEIPDCFLGDVLKIEVAHGGFLTAKRTLTVNKPVFEMPIKLRKPGDPAVKGTGLVSINARPWANVFHKGRKLGVTPLRKKKVSAGKQRFTLKNKNGTKTVTITVPRNGSVSKSFDLR